MFSPSQFGIAAAYAGLAMIPLIAFGWWGTRLWQRGGRVVSHHFRLPDALATTSFAVFLIFLVIYNFRLKTAAAVEPLLGVRDVVEGTFLFFLIALVLGLFLALRKGALGHFTHGHGLSPGRLLGYAALFLFAVYPAMLLLTQAMQIFVPAIEEQAPVILFRRELHSGTPLGLAIIVGATALVAPVIEEFIFRGYFYGSLKRYLGPIGAALIVSALFAGIHVNVNATPALFALALGLTVAYEWTGSLLVPIAMHMMFNSANLAGIWWQATHLSP